MRADIFDFSMIGRKTPTNPHWIENDESRKDCNLITIDTNNNTINYTKFSKLNSYVNPGDVVVLNNSRLIANAFIGYNNDVLVKFILHGFTPHGIVVTPFLADIKRSSKFTLCNDSEISIELIQRNSDASWNASVSDPDALVNFLSSQGERIDEYVSSRYFYTHRNAYEAVFASRYGSLDIPSAGIHFTQGMIDALRDKGAIIQYVTLHVSTSEMESNRIVNTKNVEDFTLSPEYYEVPAETAHCINKAAGRGNKVFAIGTTVARSLESAFDCSANKVIESKGWTTLYINPSYKTKVVDCLLTNLHQPKSSHMVLTAQFAGTELLMKAYNSMEMDMMNFDLFGDCMLVMR
ncbi:S-adenosylmethionine:tRNA ribosyltransferase-isomerase [Brucellaceae bacterium D45D]